MIFYITIVATIILYNITLSIIKDYIDKKDNVGNKLIVGSIVTGYIAYAILALCAR